MIRLIIFIMLFSSLSLANNQTLYYEPSTITLTGIIKILKFPGPTNYTSIKDGDANETGSYLFLDRPINIEINSSVKSNNDQPEKNVSLLQLVVGSKRNWNSIQEGYRVRVTGTAFRAITGHHHTRVLLNLEKISLISNTTHQNNQLQLTKEDEKFLKEQHLQPNK